MPTRIFFTAKLNGRDLVDVTETFDEVASAIFNAGQFASFTRTLGGRVALPMNVIHWYLEVPESDEAPDAAAQ